MLPKSIEELCELRQSGQITWLEFALQSEYSEEYSEWCKEVDAPESDDTAFLFFEKKESDCFSSEAPTLITEML